MFWASFGRVQSEYSQGTVTVRKCVPTVSVAFAILWPLTNPLTTPQNDLYVVNESSQLKTLNLVIYLDKTTQKCIRCRVQSLSKNAHTPFLLCFHYHAGSITHPKHPKTTAIHFQSNTFIDRKRKKSKSRNSRTKTC